MNSFRSMWLAFVVSLFLAGTVSAAGLPQPRVEYSADSVMQSQAGEMRSKIYQGSNRQRMEMNQGGGRQVMILRMDKKVSWVLMPEQKMYMEISLKEGQKRSGDMSACDVRQKSLGDEVVNGFRTTKSSVAISCPDGNGYDGTLWTTREGIMMKMEAVAKGEGERVSIRTELKNLKIARQNPSLFEVPAGYRKMSMGGGIGGMIGALPGGNGVNEGSGDSGRSYTSQPRDTGRSYTARPRDTGRDYTSKQRDTGRSYTAQPRDTGRDYTSQQRTPGAMDAVKKLKGLFGW